MDQVRTALVWLKEQHFWVLSGLVAIIALFCWSKASGKMSATFAKGQSDIKAEFESVKKVQSDPFHPNDDVNEKQAAQTKQQAEDVRKLWQALYDRQRKQVLEWPQVLTKEFRDTVEKLQFGANIPEGLRNNYQNYISNHYPELPKQIDARPIDENVTASPGGAPIAPGRPVAEAPGGAGEVTDDNDYIVEWDAADQALIRDKLNFPQQPRSLRIWVTQEDLWVYHTLLDVIAKTNQAAGATRNSNAAIPRVMQLAVGRTAGQESRKGGRLLMAPSAPQGGGGPPGTEAPAPPGGPPAAEGPSGGRGTEMMMMERGPGGNGEMTEDQERAFLLFNRYLDAQGKPIPFGGGGAAAGPDAQPTPPAGDANAGGAAPPIDLTVFGQEYKRLPVRMVLRMDQRWLPYLISVCASEPLQIEVQEVRVNVTDATGVGNGGPAGGGIPGGPGGARVFADEPPVQSFPMQTEMVNVVIQGTIYIFNKPNPALLSPGDQQQPATPPAARNDAIEPYFVERRRAWRDHLQTKQMLVPTIANCVTRRTAHRLIS